MENVSQEKKTEEAKPEEKEVVEKQKEAGGTELSPMERADATLIKITEAEGRVEKIAQRLEAAASRMMLGGKADAGEAIKTQEELNSEEAEKQAKEIADRFKTH